MSAESQPISSASFALAIQDLPVENIYSKAFEINNSIAHLERSNQQLQEYSDSIRNDTSLPEESRQEGDKDCLEAIRENVIVINRQKERVDLLRKEVERRGGKWHDATDTEEVDGGTNGHTGGDEQQETNPQNARGPGGRLTDDELRRQMMDRLGGNEAEEDEDGGMHL